MITLSSLEYSYPAGDTALLSIDLIVPAGATVGLAGANGSGKSTLLGLVAGLYSPTSGSLEVGGNKSPGEEQAIRSLCRLVMQDADLQILGATVEEDLLMGRKRDDVTRSRARDMAERFRLLDAWDKPVQTLSWGMKRKLCLASALLDEPRVLLLDEPFSGLDFHGIREMRSIIRSNRQAGLTQVVSTHDLECLVDLVDSLVVLEAGRVVLAGLPESLMDKVARHGVRPPCAWHAGHGVDAWGDA